VTRALAACCLLGAIGLSGCTGGGEGQSASEGPGIGQPTRLVQCKDWETADPQERRGTIEALREFAGGPTGSPGGRGATLDDGDAYKVLDRWCSQPYARGFRLYKLYTRAAAFQSLAE
jgi:hypothetical protein